MTIQEFLDDNEALKKLVQKYDQRYHVFNNKEKEHTGQVQGLFMKILQPYFATQEEEVLEGLKQNPLMRKTPTDFKPDAPAESFLSRRIVLLGKSGVGKSASGNTILGQKEFNSVMSASSVTHECSEVHATVSGRSVSVVDTPGFFDTKMKHEELMIEIGRSVYISSPGPHALIIMLRIDERFTEQELQILQQIEMLFGQEVLKYSIILFTYGDQLEDKSVAKLIEENCRLRDLVDQCGGRFHVFNNKDQNNREQVNDLLQKIDTMIEQNGGGHYSNQMFEDAQRFRREEEERRQREEEERKQQEEKQIQEELERVRKETEERIRAKMRAETKKQSEEERRKQAEEQRKECSAVVGAVVGAGVGAVAGAVVGAGVGAVAGAGVGAVAGAVVGAGVGAVAGAVVGAGVGAVVGAGVGAVAGAVVGAGVGAVVGAGVGAVVGAAIGVKEGAVVDAFDTGAMLGVISTYMSKF